MCRVLILSAIAAACAPRVVRLPHSLPPSVQLITASLGRVWVAGFATTQTSELDVSAETVRLLRTELRRLSPLLKERPAIAGLAVPGMPIGSPGMELPGRKAQPFDVLAFDKHGQTRVFASHGK